MFHRLRTAWKLCLSSPKKGDRIVVTRKDMVGLKGHLFNPFPTPEGRWTILIDDPYDGRFANGFQHLRRHDFVLVEDEGHWNPDNSNSYVWNTKRKPSGT